MKTLTKTALEDCIAFLDLQVLPLTIPVHIIDVRIVQGSIIDGWKSKEYLITPVNGKGHIWVEAIHVTLGFGMEHYLQSLEMDNAKETEYVTLLRQNAVSLSLKP